MPRYLKRCLHWCGSLLALIGIFFVYLKMRNYIADIEFGEIQLKRWLALFGLAVVYAMSSVMLAFAWCNILQKLGVDSSRRWAVVVYGISQIAKYAPGNIWHLASRQSLGMSAGISGWTLGKTVIWEMGLVSAAGCICSVLALPLFVDSISGPMAVLMFFMFLGLANGLMKHWAGWAVARAFSWYTMVLLVGDFPFTSKKSACFPGSRLPVFDARLMA